MSDVTRILESIDPGDPKAADELLPQVYGELRKLAAAKMANEAPNQTLQPTALVHEAWLRLVGNTESKFENRAHFFAAATVSEPHGNVLLLQKLFHVADGAGVLKVSRWV